jgi:hypothetical protein
VIYQKGYVEDWEWGPNEKIYGDVESDVKVLSPDTVALNADFQIQNYLLLMEELAGAPKEAMGIRTPGEKTAFEVSSLQNTSSRIFQHKINFFEEQFLEPLLNQMLASARQHFDAKDTIAILDDEFGAEQFKQITKEDIQAEGKLVPIGARHFARQIQLAQDLINFTNSGAYQDPSVQAHISGIQLAKAFEELLGFERFELVQENVRVAEQTDTQSATEVGLEQVVEGIQDRSARSA